MQLYQFKILKNIEIVQTTKKYNFNMRNIETKQIFKVKLILINKK